MLRRSETWEGTKPVATTLVNPIINPTPSPKLPLFFTSDQAISQDRIPGIADLIPNFHAHYNNLQILWAGRFPKYSPWKGLEIPLATTSDPRSIQGHSGYMDWVIEQNVKRLARKIGWDETGYASDYLKSDRKGMTLAQFQGYDVSRFSLRDRRVVLKPIDYTDYISGTTKSGLIAEEGLYKRKLDQLGNLGQEVRGKDVVSTDVGFLGMVDKFFLWVNTLFGD